MHKLRVDPGWGIAAERYPAFADVPALCGERVAGHGDAARWLAALDALPEVSPGEFVIGDTVRMGRSSELSAAQCATLGRALRELCPWRKGPFEFFGTLIDTEWRSDWKWARIRAALADLRGGTVLDVGAGNGYYGWRMLECGASFVLGVDPTIVFSLQHRAVSRYAGALAGRNVLLPLRLEDLPDGPRFDTVFSMGVVYHRREPRQHLARLYARTNPGGRVVIESLVVGPEHAPGLEPGARYARMRNVWMVPTIETLQAWLREAGFAAAEVVSVARTSTAEQRTTDWMPFESLAAALDPDDSLRTVEGHPAPVRAIIVAHRPSSQDER